MKPTRVLTLTQKLQVFTPREAWNLFRIAAIGEAVGWSLLITGLLFRYYLTPGNSVAISIAGQIHGTLFLVYLGFVLTAFPSLRWSKKRIVIALAASVPPFGTLVFERWAARQRKKEVLRSYRQISVRALILYKDELLLIQPQETANWLLPGGILQTHEAPEQGLIRWLKEMTAIKPEDLRLRYVVQSNRRSEHGLELIFTIGNTVAYRKLGSRATPLAGSRLDEIGFKPWQELENFEPAFLLSTPLTQLIRPSADVEFIST